ncbi:MAG: epoxyqueuosine reductase QueH [Syntrophomonadaceae bacterium]|nr:epoxyqueuosine reductase QueH [Syntrophomonadaceae bacterium]
MSKVLLHICCGPCATYPVARLRELGYDVKGYFYNPNIHPYTEYVKRKEALEKFAHMVDLDIIAENAYSPDQYFQQVAFRESQRCRVCYRIRLEKAVRIAKSGKFNYFTTTLLVSRFQKHDLIREIGQDLGEKYGVAFLYLDFREGFKDTVTRSKEMNLYRQQYCGCLYSEMERYQRKETKIKKA